MGNIQIRERLRSGRAAVRTLACVALALVAGAALLRAADGPADAPRAKTTAELISGAAEAVKQGDSARAAQLFDQARKNPDFVASKPPLDLIFAVGDHHFAQGTHEEQEAALATYGLAVEVYGSSLEPIGIATMRARRAEVLARQGKVEQAKEEINAIRQGHGLKHDRRAQLMADLAQANLHLLQNQPEAARDGLVPLSEADDPTVTPMALFSLGRAYVQLNQPDQAVATFRTLWARYGDSDFVKRAVFIIGQVYFDRGDFLEARKLYEACGVVGAGTQTRVRPGEELVIKVTDHDYFARTRSHELPVIVRAPSGDRETVKLEKNRVSDELYVGRVLTALGAPKPGDTVLQVFGSDTLEIAYAEGGGRTFKVMVVDDGSINIDSVPLAPPPPRHRIEAPTLTSRLPCAPEGPAPVVPTGQQSAGSLNPGSPVYVQVVDADLDATDRPDTVKAIVQVNDPKGTAAVAAVEVVLSETGNHTGVFAGTVSTTHALPRATATSEAVGHPAASAIDVDADSDAPAAAPDANATTRPATAPAVAAPRKPRPASSYWMPRPGEKSYVLEVDLQQPAALGQLTWGTGTDKNAAGHSPKSMRLTIKGPGADRTIPIKTPAAGPTGNVLNLGGVFGRTLRFEIDQWEGDAPAIGQLVLTDAQGGQLLPAGGDAPDKSVLEFAVGQTISARYLDERNESPGTPVWRESRRLGAGYHDGAVSFATVTAAADAAGKGEQTQPLFRLPGEGTQRVVIHEPDADTTVNPDKLHATAYTESGSSVPLDLTETGPATGTFAGALPLAFNATAKGNPKLLYVGPGELLWVSYLDERNLNPGSRTYRHAWIQENRATGGEFLSLSTPGQSGAYSRSAAPDRPLVTTAWPFEVKPADDGTMRIVPPEVGKGRVNVTILDPDAVSDGGRKLPVKVQSLVGGAATDLALSASGAGTSGAASSPLDLILGDKDVDRRLDQGDVTRASPQLSVVGDDIVRLSYIDERVATSDSQLRPVMTEEQLKARAAKPGAPASADAPAPAPGPDVVPLVSLHDPQRRIVAQQEQRLADLRTEMGTRVVGYRAELELANRTLARARSRAARTPKPLAKPPVTQPATSPSGTTVAAPEIDPLQREIQSGEARVALLTSRISRLTALGAKAPAAGAVPLAPPPATAPAEPDAALAGANAPQQPVVDPVKAIVDGPIIPGQPFDVTIDDADLPGDVVPVRVRSLAGRLVDTQTFDARRDAGGVFRVRIPTELSDAGTKGSIAILPGGQLLIDYDDPKQVAPAKVERVDYFALGSDALVRVMNANYFDEVSHVRLGEPVYLEVADYDADRSLDRDQVTVVARSDRGDTLLVTLTETEPHSGVFRGKFVTDNAEPVADDDVLQAQYGGGVEISYHDALRQTTASPEYKVVRLHVMGGSDGTVEAFSRQFRDPHVEMQLWYRTGQAAYQIGRRLYLGGSLARAEDYLGEAGEYFGQLVTRVPDDPLAASASYYLGNIRFLRADYRGALERYQDVVTRWPKSEFVPRSRFKVGQCFEELGQFDAAADAYVLLTYHHPSDPYVPMAMIRMMNHYARGSEWLDATAIAEKFVEKFPQHEQAGPAALKAGQWLTVAEQIDQAIAWYVESEKTFAKSDRDMPPLLYWHAATLIQSGRASGGPRGDDKVRELLNRVVYDYPRSPYASLGRSALEQLNAQK